MSMSSGPQKEHPSTYVVQDRSSQDEMKRLQIQGSMLTASMGGGITGAIKPGQLPAGAGCGMWDWELDH